MQIIRINGIEKGSTIVKALNNYTPSFPSSVKSFLRIRGTLTPNAVLSLLTSTSMKVDGDNLFVDSELINID